jgi:membrane-associated phospholipid phosphatase
MSTAGIARGLSTLGHPLLTMSLFALFLALRSHDLSTAAASILICAVTVPAAAWTYRKRRQGVYSNFDVSERGQRPSMYAVLIGLMAAASGAMWTAGLPYRFVIGSLCALLLLVLSFCMNFVLKASLHTAFSFYLAVLLWSIGSAAGLTMLALAVLVAWSRVELRRHTVMEVLAGSMLGLVCALAYRLAV